MVKYVTCILLFVAGSALANDAITLSQQISSDVETYFYKKDFESINKLDDQFRNSQSRLPDGRWKLTFIYENLDWVSSRGKDDEWQFKLKLVDEWIRKTPTHPAPYLAKADILIGYAWDARGNGWASKVKESQWPIFHSRIAEARKVLEKHSSIVGKHPYYFLEMEKIGKDQNWSLSEFTKLYDVASDLYPTYYYIHFRAADYFQPRWHGSEQELRKFVEDAVNKSKDKEGYTLYTRIYWSQLWALKENTFAEGYAEWVYMKQGFEDIMRDYPSSVWNLNAFAYYSCMAKDWKTTKTLVGKIGDNPHLSIWNSKSKYYTCRNLAES